MGERMSRAKSGAKRLLKSLGSLKVFFRNKQGVAGIIIIIGFAVMAIGAPLLSDKDPVRDENLAGDIAAPIWLRYLPTWLGGDPSLSENFYAVSSSFDNDTAGWDWTNVNHTSVQWNQSYGFDSMGSLETKFTRDETGVFYNKSTIDVFDTIYYPYGGPPRTFSISAYLSASGTSVLENKTLGTSYKVNVTVNRLVITPTVKFFIRRESDGARWTIWPFSGTMNYTKDGEIDSALSGWVKVIVSARDSDLKIIAFGGKADVATTTFKGTPGNFTLGMSVTFDDSYNDTIPAWTSVHLDRATWYCAGESYGLLGTDQHGADLWSQLVFGSRVSLYVGLLSAVISVVIGLIVGLAAGFLGRAVDEILMRLTDLLLVIPFLPLLLVLVAIFGSTMQNLVIVIGVLGWMGFARVVRAQVLSLRERTFIESAKAIGAGRTHIMIRHILPNIMSLVYVTLASSVPGAITAEAALSFLGFYDPTRISWGRMLNQAEFVGGGALVWWWVLFPGLCIALLAMSFIMLGFALDEILNPKLRLRR